VLSDLTFTVRLGLTVFLKVCPCTSSPSGKTSERLPRDSGPGIYARAHILLGIKGVFRLQGVKRKLSGLSARFVYSK
jgi:hypothetical protein